jgi:uncharacterized membrane protein
VSDESQGPGWWLASDGKWYPPELAPGAPPPTAGGPVGGYGAPGGGWSASAPGGGYGAAPSTVDVGPALSYGWNKFTSNFGPVLLIVLIPIGVQIVLSIISRVLVHSLGGVLVFWVISEVISLMLAIGIFNAGLMVTAGEAPEVGKAFSSDRWGEWILFALVWGIMVGIGLLLCGVGALVVIAIWGLAPFYFIDQRMSLGEALSASSRTTSQVPGIRVALALTALVGVAGIIACGVGVLATMPTAYIAAAYLYRVANHQPVAA